MPWLVAYWRMAIRWKWVIGAILLGALISGFVVTILATPEYTAVASIEISRQQERIVNVSSVEPEVNFADQEFYQTQYTLLRSRALADAVAAKLNLAANQRFLEVLHLTDNPLFGAKVGSPAERVKRKVSDVLLANVGVAPIRGSKVVSISFTSPDPGLSAQVANTWVAEFIDSNLARRYDATAYARRFLEQRLEQLRGRLEESERALVSYASQQQIINVASAEPGDPNAPRVERSLVADDLTALSRSLTTATADRIDAESRLREANGAASTQSLNNLGLSSLRQQRTELAAEYAKLMIRYKPDYTPAKELASQLQVLDRGIAREEGRVGNNLRNNVAAATQRERELQASVDGLKAQLLDQRRRSIQYNIYQREVDTNRQLYDALLQRYKEIGVAGGVGTNNVAVVDQALIPDRPSSPRLLLNLIVALFGGLVVATAVVFALEHIDDKVADPSDIKRIMGLSLLGSVPIVQGNDPVDELLDRKSPLSEAYLSIQTVLGVSTDHGLPRSLSVTSTGSGEGKTTTSLALALTMARTGRRVVLIDCDMRSASVHKVVGIENTAGVSNFLAGNDDVDALLCPVEPFGLTVMTAGPQPANAAELLTGARIDMLLAKLRDRFDHVMIDGPPVLGLADAPLIGAAVEGVVCVIEANGARIGVIRPAFERLLASRAVVIGAVLTKFDARRAHYGYGYEYGFNYGKKAKS